MSPEIATSAAGHGPVGLADDGGGRNVELKARDPAPNTTLEQCRGLGAVDCGLLWQRDTYFDTVSGRLKLREQRPGRCQLIHYRRAEKAEQRESSYRIVEISDPEPMRALLSDSLGIRSVVTKRRRLFLWRSVRIHLDDVEGQGRFIEFEAVAAADSDLSAEHTLIAELRSRLAITDGDLVGESYGDLAHMTATSVEAGGTAAAAAASVPVAGAADLTVRSQRVHRSG